jgi:hypothetical protein
MSRVAALACLAALAGFAPLQAEAARFRLRSSPKPSTPARVMIVPIVSGSQARAATAPVQPSSQPETPRTMPAEVAPPLRLGATEPSPHWCRSEVVVGGFCVMN